MAMEYARLPLEAAGPPDNLASPPPPLPVSQRTRGSSLMRQQRRLALEQEVAELKQQLSNEETVHHILERALQPSRSPINIPAFIFIPGKVKELLAELVLVEEEIARLEAQIKHMKQQRSPLPPIVVAASTASDSAPAASATDGAATVTTPNKSKSNGMEMKSMFFISQAMAMDGDYLKRHLADDKDKKQKQKPPRHSNSSHHQLPPSARHELPIVITTTTTTEEINCSPGAKRQKMHPNKLSERILKCLVCIFIRLLRSSRVAELLDNKDRSSNTPGMSFRMDAGLNVASSVSSGSKERESRRGHQQQQDHYGIFGIQDAIVRDVGPYKNLVRFTSAALDPRAFSSSPLLTKLRGMLEALQQVDLSQLSHHQKLAFWLNVYNTCIMHGILQHGPPSESEKLLALKNKATINVSGQTFNALVIENFILRQPSSVKEEFWRCDVDVQEQEVRSLYGLNTSEPNILFALCCGIRSSPALRIYKADRVLVDLDKAKLEYLQASLVVTSTRRLMIPDLIRSNMHDFAKDMDALLRWICDQLPTSWALRKSMVECLRRAHQNTNNVVDVIPFDYEFQYLLPMM